MARRGLVKVPDQRDIQLMDGKYRLTSTGLEVHGKPTFAEHEGVGEFIKRAHQASGWWLADWLRYGESRRDWADRLSQAVHVTGLSEKRLKNIREAGAIEPSRRRETVEFALHEEVCRLPAEEQAHWLEMADTEGWNRAELRANISASRRKKVLEGQALLEGLYRVIYADPPWAYNNRGDIRVGKSSAYKRAEAHYPTLTIEELCKLPVEAHALPNSVLFLWVTAPILLQNPGPREVMEAWGFEYKENFVWDKVLGNFGHYNHVTHEHLIVATRGRCLPDRPTPSPKSVIVERRSDVHSAKPQSVRRMVEKLYDGPYLELFGREKQEGWTVFGNDARLWHQEMEQIA